MLWHCWSPCAEITGINYWTWLLMGAHVNTSSTLFPEPYPQPPPPYYLRQGFSLNQRSWTGKSDHRGLRSHLSMPSSLGYRLFLFFSPLVLGIQTQVQCLHSKNFTESSLQSSIYFHCLLSMMVTDFCVFLQTILEFFSYLACIKCWEDTNQLMKDFFTCPYLFYSRCWDYKNVFLVFQWFVV